MAFKCIKGLAPPSLCNKFTTRSQVHSRNTRNNDKLNTPFFRLATGQRSSHKFKFKFNLFTLILTNYVNNGKKKEEKEERKSSYMCTRYYFEIVRSGQRSRAFELATTTVQLIVRGGYLQNIHEVNTI